LQAGENFKPTIRQKLQCKTVIKLIIF